MQGSNAPSRSLYAKLVAVPAIWGGTFIAGRIIALNPVTTIATASLLLGEHLSPRRWIGIGVALVGVWIVVSRGDVLGSLPGAIGAGELLMFGGVCAWAAYTLLGRRVLTGMTPLAATTHASLWGAAMLAVAAIPDLRSLDVRAITASVVLGVLYLGVLGTALAFVWYYQAVHRLGASRTVIFTNLVPVFGAAFGVLLLGEPLLPSMLLGSAVAVAGVMMASR